MTRQQELVKFIETTLNTNTQNIPFKVGYFIVEENDGLKIQVASGAYTTTTTDIVTCMMTNFVPAVEPLTSVIVERFTVPLDVVIPSEPDKFTKNNVYEALEEFQTSLNGSKQDVGGFGTAFKVFPTDSIGEPLVHEGQFRVLTSLTINVTMTDAYLGNDFAYELKLASEATTQYHTLSRINSTNTLANDLNTEQYINDFYAKSVRKQATQMHNLSFVYEKTIDVLDNLVRSAIDDTYELPNLTLKIIAPINTVELEVVVESVGVTTNIGDITVLAVVFRRVF